MSLTLHLGVLVQPYRFAGSLKGFHGTKALRQRNGGNHSALTTGDVAEFLEQKYNVMGSFYSAHERDIASAIEQSLDGALSSLLIGRVQVDPWAGATQKIETMFRDFIATKEAERVGIPGTPTKAALRGVNHRLKHPYASRNPRRPSFRDTGLYMASFKSWVSVSQSAMSTSSVSQTVH